MHIVSQLKLDLFGLELKEFSSIDLIYCSIKVEAIELLQYVYLGKLDAMD